jgi:HAE1 family hydrophobic/amphiphilic exporter-1
VICALILIGDRRLRPVAGADRLHSDRGPGLSAGRRAIARWRRARPHPARADPVSEIAGKTPGVDQVITIAGISALDNSSSLANAGVAYLILKEWSARGQGEDLRSLFVGLNEKLSVIEEARILVIPPPPIQGIGNAAGFAMQVELRDGNADYGKLQAITGAIVPTRRLKVRCNACSPRSVRWCRSSTSRSTASRRRPCTSPPTRSSRRCRPISARATSTSSPSSAAPSKCTPRPTRKYRLTLRDIQNMMVRNSNGDMIPLGTVAKITPSVGPSLISLYNLYPSASIIGLPAQGYSSGQSMALMEEIAAKTLPPAPASNGRRCRTRRRSSAARSTGVRPCAAAGLSRARRTI